MADGILLAGEAMGLLTALEEGPLEKAETFRSAVAGAEFNVAVDQAPAPPLPAASPSSGPIAGASRISGHFPRGSPCLFPPFPTNGRGDKPYNGRAGKTPRCPYT